MIPKFEKIKIGDEFVVPAYGNITFAWCFVDASRLWDHTKAPLIKVVAAKESRNATKATWNNTVHGKLVNCQDEFGLQQWVPYSVLGVIVSEQDSQQLSFDF